MVDVTLTLLAAAFAIYVVGGVVVHVSLPDESMRTRFTIALLWPFAAAWMVCMLTGLERPNLD